MTSRFSGALQITNLDDFITPSQECIKPIEIQKSKSKTGAKIKIEEDGTPFALNEAGQSEKLQKVEITLADCLACSGCITSAESVLVTQQSQEELMRVFKEKVSQRRQSKDDACSTFIVVSLSVQAVLSIAKHYSLKPEQALNKLAGYFYQLGADIVLDMTVADDFALLESAKEFIKRYKAAKGGAKSQLPMLSSSCPGWVCYAEKTHGNFILPYISVTKSPQQIMGSLVKYHLAETMDLLPEQVYHVTVMPCYDKKLEASREDFYNYERKFRDVDCVITPIEIEQMLSEYNVPINEICEFSQVVDENESQEKTVLLPKEDDSCEPQYITNEGLVIGNIDEHSQEQYEIITGQNEKNFIMEKHNVNANDFVEVVTAFKCKICTYTTQDKTQLLQHFQKTHVNPKVDIEIKEESKITDEVKLLYMCGECSNCFPSIEDCKEHMINDHQLTDTGANRGGKENITDDSKDSGLLECIGQSVESNDIKRQVKIQKPLNSEYMLNKKMIELMERNIKCSYRGCPYKFCTEETMQQHALCHTESQNGTAFKCSVCRDMKFTKWRQCSLHLWKKHQIDIGLFTCKICKAYKSATMVKLLTHMRVHSETREYECSECGKCFKQASQLRNHRVMHLDRKTLEVTRWYTSKKCDMCGKTYANSKCLKSHIQAVHSKLRPYVCNVCGHSSARKAMLQMHLRQHTGDKPFSCELCEYKTGDHNTLRRHIMQHTGFRPYKCPHCSYTAIQSSSYKNHLKSRHPLLSGLFTCDLCPFKTVKNQSYIQHVRDHEKGLIKANMQKKDSENVEVFPGNIAAAQLIYSCLGAFSKVGDTLEANLMSSSTSADGTSQTITIQIPSKHLEGSLPTRECRTKSNSAIEQEDEETMHCFLKIPREEEESIDTGGITIPAEPEESGATTINVDT